MQILLWFMVDELIAKLSFRPIWTETCIIITVKQTHPTHQGKYIWATSRLPTKLKFDMEGLLNETG